MENGRDRGAQVVNMTGIKYIIIPFLVNLKRSNKLCSFRVGHKRDCHPQFMKIGFYNSKLSFLFQNRQRKYSRVL